MTGSLPESGSLAETPLPRLLLDVQAARFTGSLDLERGRTSKGFWVQDGWLVDSSSELPAEGLARVLEDTGVLTRSAREQVEADAKRTRQPEAAALLAVEGVDARQVFGGIREQIRRRAVDCFAWEDGSFSLTASDEDRTQVDLFRTDACDLVQQGLQKHWTLDRLLQELAPRMEQYVAGNARLGKIVRRMSLDATVERMIAGLSGTQTLGSVIGTSAGSPAVLATFWVLEASGALAFSDQPRSTEADDAPPEIEIEIRDTAASPEAAATGAPERRAAAPAPGESPAQANPEAEKMRAEVIERLEHLDELSFYDLLGVEPDAPHAAIRKAYFLAAKRYHPDAIARLGLQDVRREAGEVFAKIAEANEVLADPKRRKAYDDQLAGGLPEVDVQVLAQAETFYRKGEILINMGDFRGALDFLKNAVELYPHEAAYQSDLGWAYYKKSPPEPEMAREHLQAALELDPGDQTARFRLGVVTRGSA